MAVMVVVVAVAGISSEDGHGRLRGLLSGAARNWCKYKALS